MVETVNVTFNDVVEVKFEDNNTECKICEEQIIGTGCKRNRMQP